MQSGPVFCRRLDFFAHFSQIVTMAVWRRFGEEAAFTSPSIRNSIHRKEHLQVPLHVLLRSIATGSWTPRAAERSGTRVQPRRSRAAVRQQAASFIVGSPKAAGPNGAAWTPGGLERKPATHSWAEAVDPRWRSFVPSDFIHHMEEHRKARCLTLGAELGRALP